MGRITDWWIHFGLRNAIVLGAGVLLALVALCTVVVHTSERW